MDNLKNSKSTPTKRTNDQNRINLDYDFNTEYGDGDIPDIDKPRSSTKDTAKEFERQLPERERRDGPGGN